jgi:hypothetical protein
MPTSPPLVTPGERMTYRVNLRGVEVAAMTFAVGDRTELAGRMAIPVQCRLQSSGLANLVASIDDTYTSWIDIATGRPLRWESLERSAKRKQVEHTVAEIASREGDSVPITFAIDDQPPVPEPQKVAGTEVWDYNAFLVALRRWEGTPGTRSSLEVLRSRWMWRIDVTIGGRETLVTELGELPALRFDLHATRLDRAGNKDPNSEERDLAVWISDDGDRVPLKLTATTDYGDVLMTIADYQPGTGAPLGR